MPTTYDRGFFIDENAPAEQAGGTPLAVPADEPNKYDEGYFLLDGNTAPQAIDGALTAEQIAALAGGAAGAAFGKQSPNTGVGVLGGLVERGYGIPSGSLTELHELSSPLSAEAVAQKVAEKHVLPAMTADEMPSQRSTPGGRYSEKTGYGIGEGTVAEVNERRQRAKSHGKVTKKLEAKFGVPEAGQSPQLAQRLIDKLPDIAAEQQLMREQIAADEARKSTLDKMAENIRKAGGAYGIAKHALRSGLNVGSGVLGGLHGFQGVSDIQQQGLNLGNASQTAEGAALLAAMRNPTVGLPLAGGAAMVNAGNKMYEQGVNIPNATQMLSGAGMALMPRNPIVGTVMQAPAASVAIADWLNGHPEYLPAWIRAKRQYNQQ